MKDSAGPTRVYYSGNGGAHGSFYEEVLPHFRIMLTFFQNYDWDRDKLKLEPRVRRLCERMDDARQRNQDPDLSQRE